MIVIFFCENAFALVSARCEGEFSVKAGSLHILYAFVEQCSQGEERPSSFVWAISLFAKLTS